jgi:hypothetical protein
MAAFQLERFVTLLQTTLSTGMSSPNDPSMTLTSVAGLPSSGQIRALLTEGGNQEIVLALLPPTSGTTLAISRKVEPVGGVKNNYQFDTGATVQFIYTAGNLTNDPRNMSAPGDLETLDTGGQVIRLPGGPTGQSPVFSPLANSNQTNFLQYTAHRGFSPMDFGAVADGNFHGLDFLYGSDVAAAQADFPFIPSGSDLSKISRDWAALQQCFNLAQANTGDSAGLHFGKNVYIPAGSYYIDNTITVQGIFALTCRGDGQATKLVWHGTDSTAGPLKIVSCQNCTFADFSINQAAPSPSWAIWLTNTSAGTDSIVSSANSFRRLQVNDGFVACVLIEFDTGGDNNNDLHIFEDCLFKQFTRNGIQIHGGQVHFLRFLRCAFGAASTTGTAGIYSDFGAYIHAQECVFNNCENNLQTTNFYTGTIEVRNCNSEGSRRYLSVSGANCPVAITGCRGALAPDMGDFILDLSGAATWRIQDNNFYTINGVQPLVQVGGGTYSTQPHVLTGGAYTIVHTNNIYSTGAGGPTWSANGGGALTVGGTGNYLGNVEDRGNVYIDPSGAVNLFDVVSVNPNVPAALTNGVINYKPLPGYYQLWSSTQDVIIQGMTGSGQGSAGHVGEVREIWNIGSYNITLMNQSHNPPGPAQFYTPTGFDLLLAPGHAALARYDPFVNSGVGGWRVSLLGPEPVGVLRVTVDTIPGPQVRLVEVDASAANGVQVVLLGGNSVPGGTEVVCKRIDNVPAHTVTVLVAGGGTIDGDATAFPLSAQYKWVRLVADGTANAWYVAGTNQYVDGSFGIGTGRAHAPSGLTAGLTVSDTALGYSNCRLGLAPSGQPEVVWEHAGYAQWAWDNFQGAFRLTTPGRLVLGQFAADGSYALGGSAPDASATLDLQATSKGLRLPNVSSPSSIGSPATGLLVFNSTTSKLNFWDGGAWRVVTSS